MSHPTIVLQAMQSNMWHQPDDLALTTRLREVDVKATLRQLANGGLVEVDGKRYQRNKKYKTKQRSLFS